MKRLEKYFEVVGRIFIRDLKRLIHNPIALIVVCGLCILPSLYAWYVIEANWNPYSNSGNLKVAIVNLDEGASSSYTGKLNVGNEVVEKLRDNKQLDWQFVDEETGMNGVYSGEYWAALVFPKEFSADFISLFSGDFKKPQIEYYVNEKFSGSATKVTDAGAKDVEKNVNEAFVDAASKSVMDITQKAGLEIENKADSAEGSLTRSVAEANDVIADTQHLIDDLIPTIEDSRASVGNTKTTLSNLSGQIPEISQLLDESQSMLEEVRSTLSKYSSEITSNVTESSVGIGSAAAKANTAIGNVLGELEQASGPAESALATVQQLISDNATLIDRLQNLVPSTEALQNAVSRLQQQNKELESMANSLKTATEQLESTIQAASSANETITQAAETGAAHIRDSAMDLQSNVIPSITNSLDSFAAALSTLSGAVKATEPTLTEAQAILDQLDSTLGEAQDSIRSASASLSSVQNTLSSSLNDLRSLQDSATYHDLTTYLGLNADDVASFMSSPVKLDTIKVYPEANYGSGVAPFFTNIALWVSGLMLIAVVRMRVDPEGLPTFTPTQAYLGRWLFFSMISMIQGAIVCAGDILLGVQCASPIAFIGTGILACFTYVNLMFALTFTLRHIGKALAVVVLIIQIPGSSGMFPIEMMPTLYQTINPLLPFTYSIDAMRETIGGFYQLDYLWDMLALAAFIPIGFFIGLFLGRYSHNLNLLFDEKLGEGGLFVAEKVPDRSLRFRMRTVVKALLSTEEYRENIIERADRFQKQYPKLTLAGWIAMIAMPVTMFIVLSIFRGGPNETLTLIMWFILGLLLVVTYLISITFLNSNIEEQKALAHKDNTEIAEAAKATLMKGAGK